MSTEGGASAQVPQGSGEGRRPSCRTGQAYVMRATRITTGVGSFDLWSTVLLDRLSRCYLGNMVSVAFPTPDLGRVALRRILGAPARPGLPECTPPLVLMVEAGGPFEGQPLRRECRKQGIRLDQVPDGSSPGPGERYVAGLQRAQPWRDRKMRSPSGSGGHRCRDGVPSAVTLKRLEWAIDEFGAEVYNREARVPGAPSPLSRWRRIIATRSDAANGRAGRGAG